MIEEHRGALEYDFRARFHLSLSKLGGAVEWGEAIRLIKILRADPSSMFAATLEGWDYAMPRDVAVLMDLYDLQHASKSKKTPKPYPRPWKDAGEKRRRGNAAGRTREQVVEILRAHGHVPPV